MKLRLQSFIYETLRPLVLGKLDFTPTYRLLGDLRGKTVFDFGCGFGESLKYLEGFKSYFGFDIDEGRLRVLKERYPANHIHAVSKLDLQAISPQVVIIMGALHHLSDSDIQKLIEDLESTPSIETILTMDTVFVPRQILSNFFAYLDRGRFVRTDVAYKALFKSSAFELDHQVLSNDLCGHRMTYYFTMLLKRRNS